MQDLAQRPRCSLKRPFFRRKQKKSVRRVKEITCESIRFIKMRAKPTCRRLKDNNANEFSWTCLRTIVCQRAPGFMRTVLYVCQNVRNARTRFILVSVRFVNHNVTCTYQSTCMNDNTRA